MSDTGAYRRILKSSSLFGGVQVVNILVSIARSKIIALLIGPAGMGIAGLLTSAISLIGNMTSLGLETSAVKYISEKNEIDKEGLPKVISVLQQTVWATGITGAIATILLAPWLSRLTFGDNSHSVSFMWLSLTLLFRQLANGQLAVLQGLQRLQFLAKANFSGSISGLLISAPLYYYYRIDAIVPAMIASSAIALLFSSYYARKISITSVRIAPRHVLREGKGMLFLGIMLSLSAMATAASAYVIQVYIADKGGIAEAGLYNAGFLLLNSYVGLVFTAMGTDYLPRLSAVSNDPEKTRTIAGQQAMVSVLLITPVIAAFLAFTPSIIRLLFSDAFKPIILMVSMGILGMLFRAVSWSIGYILLAKGDSAMFIRTAFGFNVLFLALHVTGYYFYGLTGLGIAFTIHYFIHFVGLYVIASKRYAFSFSFEFLKIFLACTVLCTLAFLFTFIAEPVIRIPLALAVILAAAFFCYRQLRNKAGLPKIASKIFKSK